MSSNPNARRGVPEKLKVSEKVGNSKKPSASYPSSPDSGRSSPGSSCSICLRRHENKSYTNNCLHEFCFTCLLEWSKVKPECPLCKQAFTSIIHNVRANHEYDEHKIPLVDLEEPDVFDQLLHHQSYYRITATSERTRMFSLESLHTIRQFAQEGVLPHPTERRPTRSRLIGTCTLRRRVYQRDLWVRPMSDITGRYRETTSEFFQLNPAMTHRLVPWLNRELNVLLVNYENRLSCVVQLILRLITRFHIRSRAFREAIQSYIGAYTEHFIHEFFQFARSPYDMYGFDENADYQPRNNLQQEEVVVSESSEEDVSVTRSFSNEQRRVVIPLNFPFGSLQPGPSGICRGSSSAAMIDDGQSYSAIPGHSNAAGRPSDEDEEDSDIEIVEVVRPSPVVITLSESGEDREEDAERNEASSTSSRDKALKQSSRPHRDQQQQQRTKSKEEKSKPDRSSWSVVRSELGQSCNPVEEAIYSEIVTPTETVDPPVNHDIEVGSPTPLSKLPIATTSPSAKMNTTPPGDMLHHIKNIQFKDKNVGIVTQNENGPCPLVAIINVLLLRRQITLITSLFFIIMNLLLVVLSMLNA